ncbi:peptide methionine sulfoxide reductase [Nonlabens sp. MB-3u-79]|mgnify:CR=1 FL=1|jgi:peptide-methionine (S)-S-oxide reductase|uniref:peptide-methionine (S)-S-oxide reductase n=1 Tax=Nonlabens sp. MB-3u-79 TaxID=2058134 RepID=UPI000C30CE11|nr:peptide-methionine (S)-S-oxide reductase [Nonlabens sp. MB-3u-79]AUC77929.1 peptide methionine sulfoxide reductase [Nonlabens sp. MB-3u-79]|tara:strand:+ start:29273 stop:29755 length:483 start_codon:yes stop_codon:yes gene_type:complete
MKTNTQLGLGGGCHWCTEAVFQAIDGVESVEQGYISSTAPYENKSEAVIIHFTDQVDLEKLIDIHLQTHAATKQHSRRNDYRSAIYYIDEELKNRIEVIISSLSRKRKQTYITKVLELESFEPSRESIQNYYQTRPEAPFCKRYIEPKLKLVKKLTSSIN